MTGCRARGSSHASPLERAGNCMGGARNVNACDVPDEQCVRHLLARQRSHAGGVVSAALFCLHDFSVHLIHIYMCHCVGNGLRLSVRVTLSAYIIMCNPCVDTETDDRWNDEFCSKF